MSKKPRHVIGIGGSSGSMSELFTILEGPLPRNCAFVVPQFLPADFKERLFSISTLHVIEAVNGMYLRNNTLYLLPDNQYVSLKNGQLHLTPADNSYPAAMDTFLTSISRERGEQAIAIILAGEGTDGSIGAKAIRDQGGSVLVRNPMTTGFNSMPASAIATGAADHILEPAEMGEALQSVTAGRTYNNAYSSF